jgi:hypothetical protein
MNLYKSPDQGKRVVENESDKQGISPSSSRAPYEATWVQWRDRINKEQLNRLAAQRNDAQSSLFSRHVRRRFERQQLCMGERERQESGG